MDNQSQKLPLLIYDGDCHFCLYWAQYWQKLTGTNVNYRPYQEVASEFPSIPRENFKRAVQYVSTEGKIASAAEASFLTLSHAPGQSIWLTLYRKLPGFSFFAEKAYALIAAHRSFFYFFTLLFWGRNYEPPRYEFISWLFVRVFALIFLVAFISFGSQALGLIGSQGIIPISEFVDAARSQLGSISYRLLPMVFWFNASDLAVQLTCWGGIALSLTLFFNIIPRISLLLLYVLYLSLTCAGQVFMSFQWDTYLLETAFITIFLVGFTGIGIFLLRWLLFRFILAGGLVKIFSGDPTWQNFSALSYYFQTEPLPTPLAWYANQLPPSILSAATAIALGIELIAPFLIFFPRRIRFISAFSILLLQIIILITGNYNFFNILTILLCLVLFDDAAIRKLVPSSLKMKQTSPSKLFKWTAFIFAVTTIFISLVQFQIRFIGTVPAPILALQDATAPFHIVNTYGPFAVITTERMEIVIEGSDDGIHWSEYAFKYKPGDIYRRPLWNIPFQPRLDWQMWFAALGSYEENPWFLRFMQRLLENSPDVIALLEYTPFPNHPPHFVRAQFYEYRFTNAEERQKTGAWWDRRLVRYYLPEVNLSK